MNGILDKGLDVASVGAIGAIGGGELISSASIGSTEGWLQLIGVIVAALLGFFRAKQGMRK